jgi:maleate isomerase
MEPYGYRARIGYTSPPMLTEVFPYEFYRIVPKGVTLVLTTLAVNEYTRDEVDESLAITFRAARQMGRSGVDLIVLGGIPINLSRGFDGLSGIIKQAEEESGVPVTTSISAQVHALETLGSRKIALVLPQRGGSAKWHQEYLEHFGFEMVGATGGGESLAPGKTPPDLAFELAREVIREHPEADTVYFPAPHRPVADSLDPIEKELGVTVLGAHQAICWEALRLCKIDDRIDGYGRLLRDF